MEEVYKTALETISALCDEYNISTYHIKIICDYALKQEKESKKWI